MSWWLFVTEMNCTDTFFQTLHYLESSAPKYSYPLKKKILHSLWLNKHWIYIFWLQIFTTCIYKSWLWNLARFKDTAGYYDNAYNSSFTLKAFLPLMNTWLEVLPTVEMTVVFVQKVTLFGSRLWNRMEPRGTKVELAGASKPAIVHKYGMIIFGNDGKMVSWHWWLYM